MKYFKKKKKKNTCTVEIVIDDSILAVRKLLTNYSNVKTWWPDAYVTTDQEIFNNYLSENYHKEIPCKFLFLININSKFEIGKYFLFRATNETFGGKYHIYLQRLSERRTHIIWTMEIFIAETYRKRLDDSIREMLFKPQKSPISSNSEFLDNKILQQMLETELSSALKKLKKLVEK